MATDPKSYKAEEDPERAFYLMSFAHLARDYPGTAALSGSFMKELAAMSLRQAERNAKADKEEAANRAKEAVSAAATEEAESPPSRARAR